MTAPDASFFEVAASALLNPRVKISSDMSTITLINQSFFTIHTKIAVFAAYGEKLPNDGLDAVYIGFSQSGKNPSFIGLNVN